MARRWHRGAGRSWAEAAGARLPGPETKKAGQGPAFVPLLTAAGGLFLRRGGRAVVAHPVGLAVETAAGGLFLRRGGRAVVAHPVGLAVETAAGGLFLRRGGRAVVAHPVGLAVERRVGLLLATLAVHHVGQHAGADDRRRGSHRDRVAADGAGRDAGAGAGGTQGGTGLEPVFGTVAGVAHLVAG